LLGLFVGIVAPCNALGEPTPAAIAGYNVYVRGLEERLEQQHRSDLGFIAGLDATPGLQARLRGGELVVEALAPANRSDLPGAMLHHWRATAFVAGANSAAFERLLRDFGAYPHIFAPQVLSARVLSQSSDRAEMTMRVRQQHVITVVMDASYQVDFGRLDALHGYSDSRSTRIAEIGSAGTSAEHVLSSAEEHGFLWRQNTYWSFAERDGGLYVQVESVSLSRAIPRGLAWAVRPFVESVPRESLEFTLRSVINALRR